jgi:hypothetical protein
MPWRWIASSRPRLVALAAAAAAALAAGLLLGAPGPEPSLAAAPHVARAHGRTYIADRSGRWLFLRGVGVNGLVEYGDDFRETVAPTQDDVAEMAALGFNVIRLAVSWSRVAPRPGEIDAAYLDQIAAVTRWAEAKGIRVVVGMHTDRYNRRLLPGDEADGAPDWATLTDGQHCDAAYRCVDAAWRHFWNDDRVAGKGLQEHYLDALLAVSRRLRADHELLGLELVNNPAPGAGAPADFEREQLWPFYRRMIAGLRADGEHRMIWIDRPASSEMTDRGVAERFSADPDLVYAPHAYTEVFSPPRRPTGSLDRLDAFYVRARSEAAVLGAALFVGEWGARAGGPWERWRDDELDLQDRYRVGSAFWMWKQRPGFYNWQTVEPDGGLRHDSDRAQALSRPHPDAVPGVLRSVRNDGDRLTARVNGSGGTAQFWSGTIVLAGGRSALAAPLTRVRVDGRRVRAVLRRHQYVTGHVDLGGYAVSVRLPAGSHTVVLAPDPVRACLALRQPACKRSRAS